MVLESIVKPVVLGLESNENAGGLSMTGDHDFAVRGETEITREIVLDLRQRDLTSRACRTRRATLGLRLSR